MDGTLHLLGAREVWIGIVLGGETMGIERRMMLKSMKNSRINVSVMGWRLWEYLGARKQCSRSVNATY